MKECGICGYIKIESEFYAKNSAKDGLDHRCKECSKIARRESKLQKNFGITSVEYDLMFEDQGGKCFICEADSGYNGNKLSVDHDHNTGEIRGLLCHKCNFGIAHFNDDRKRLMNAMIYLDRKGTGMFIPE